MSWIQTYTGRKFDLVNPTPDMVCLQDIAHALSHTCRYTGHCSRFYSVAEHSVRVANLVPPELAVQGLLHDATEAYVADLSRPLKSLLPEYKVIEQRVWVAIADRFNLPHELDPAVKRADNVMLVTERRDLLGPQPEPWAPELEALVSEMDPRRVIGLAPRLARDEFFDACDHYSVR